MARRQELSCVGLRPARPRPLKAKPDVDYTMVDYMNDTTGRMMDAVGWARAKVVGVSFGGMVAQELVLRHPDKSRAAGAGLYVARRRRRPRIPLPRDPTPEGRGTRPSPDPGLPTPAATPRGGRQRRDVRRVRAHEAPADPYAGEPGARWAARRRWGARRPRHVGRLHEDRLLPGAGVAAGRFTMGSPARGFGNACWDAFSARR